MGVEIITIKRVTTGGILKPTGGRLVSCKGYEFCFCEEEGNYYLIELSTGMTVGTYNAQEWMIQGYTPEDALLSLRDNIVFTDPEKIKDGILKAVDMLNEYGITYPVNKPIINKD